MESKICNAIENYNINGKYYRHYISRAENAVNKGETIYAYSPKKDEVVVSLKNNIYCRLFMSGLNLRKDCSCKSFYECEHVLQSIIFAKNYVEVLDKTCNTESSSDFDLENIYNNCKRLVGSENVLLKYYDKEFKNNIILLENLNNYEKNVYSLEILFNIVTLLHLLVDEYKTKINESEEIIQFMNKILSFDEETIKQLFSENKLNIKVINALCDILSDNSSQFADEEKFSLLQDIFLNNVKENKEASVYSIIRMRANKLLLDNFDEYFNFIYEYLNSEKIVYDVLQELYNREMYSEVIYVFDKCLENKSIEEYSSNVLEIYLKSIEKIGEITQSIVDKVLNINSSIEMYKVIHKLNKDQYITNIVQKLREENYNDTQILDTLNDLEMSDLLYLMAKKKGIKTVSKYSNTIMKSNNIDVIKFYEEKIIELIENNKAITNDVKKYLKDMKKFEYGEYYLFHLLVILDQRYSRYDRENIIRDMRYEMRY